MSIIIPTIGEGFLGRCLDSIMPQLCEGDEVIVVGDLREGPLPKIEAEVRKRKPCRYLPLKESSTCDWGHGNLNAAMRYATGDWITWNDDDDVYTPDALEIIRNAALKQRSPKPIIFRYRSPFGYVVPPHAGKSLQGHMSGQCLVIPNIPERFGTWTTRYEGDYDMLQSTLAAWGAVGVSAEWRHEVIGLGRPPTEPAKITPEPKWPSSLKSTALQRFLSGVSPSAPPGYKRFRLLAAYFLRSWVFKIKQFWRNRSGDLEQVDVETLDLAQQLLRISYLCKEGAAYDQWRIDVEKQSRWWESNKDVSEAWLYGNTAKVIVGFGMVRLRNDGRLELKVGVLPHFRGCGYGRRIVKRILWQVPEVIMAKALIAHPWECRLYENKDWTEIRRDDRFIYFCFQGVK